MQIPVSHGHLEAIHRAADPPERGAAVICHPHPQHGGTMHTKAVYRSAQALAEVGFHALRFNFRGVGASTGVYGGGIGEEEDVAAAIDWLAARHPGMPILVAGFSFGSRVGLRVGVRDDRVVALVGLGLPISMADFSFLEGVVRPTLVVQGENDEYGSGEDAHRLVESLDGAITLVRVSGSDHYFHDHVDELQHAIRSYFLSGPGAAPFPTR